MEEDRWHFLELYHVNSPSTKALQLYVDSVLVKESACKVYQASAVYDENAVGCGIQLEFVGKQGEERIGNNFRGEMTALYFVEANTKILPEINEAFGKVNALKTFEGFVECSENLFEKEKIVRKIFMQVNPKYTRKGIQGRQRVLTIKHSGKNIDLFNDVERMYSDSRIDHNMSAADLLFNAGGIKVMLPFLHNIPSHHCSPKFM